MEAIFIYVMDGLGKTDWGRILRACCPDILRGGALGGGTRLWQAVTHVYKEPYLS